MDFGYILHPRDVNWFDEYADVFIPDMHARGISWKPVKRATDAQETSSTCEASERGCKGTWYAGRKAALQQLSELELPAGSPPLKLKSRAKHSAYKEGDCCQSRRLAISNLRAQKAPPDRILAAEKDFADHLKWMLGQRRVLERIFQMAGHEYWLIESSDKCGDECLYVPRYARVSDKNAGLYQYQLSLQANVFPGKLYHLSLLLPNLRTGANFGCATLMNGLCRMKQLGSPQADPGAVDGWWERTS